ncbi:MAG: histidine phosphatase family protein [Candidatus Sumerlaeaceae bacterium]
MEDSLRGDKTWTEFVVVRHGQTHWNAQERWQGWLDSELTELGREQARAAANALRAMKIDAVYSSDAGRALETAGIVATPHQLDVQPVEALRERFYGDYEGLNTEEIEGRFPGTRYSKTRDTRDLWRPPGGESLVEVAERVHAFLKELAVRHAGQRVLLIAHSGVVRVLDMISSGQRLEDIWMRTPTNACVFILRGSSTGELQVVRHFCEPAAGE